MESTECNEKSHQEPDGSSIQTNNLVGNSAPAQAIVSPQDTTSGISQSDLDDIQDNIRLLTEALTKSIEPIHAELKPITNKDSDVDKKILNAATATPENNILEDTVAAVAATVAAASTGLKEPIEPDPLPSSTQLTALPSKLSPSQYLHRENPEKTLHDDQSPKENTDASKASAVGFDANITLSQTLSSSAPANEKPSGKRSAQEAFEQNQAAMALQLIARSLSNPSAVSINMPSTTSASSLEGALTKSETLPTTTATTQGQSMEDTLRNHESAKSVSDTLMSITRAISFPTQSESPSSIKSDTEAFTRAVLTATQNEINKSKNNNDNSNNNGTNPTPSAENNGHNNSGLDHTALENLSLHQNHYIAGTSAATSHDQTTLTSSTSTSGLSQGLSFFSYDEATGKTQFKWAPDPKDESNDELQDANAKVIQQAIATIIANTGIPGLSDLSATSNALLNPPLGTFPVQGSDFGSSSDPAKPDPTPPPRKRKKPSTTKTSTQNTAASIPEGAPSFPCKFAGCDKVFARLYNLKSHSRTHTDERPFICSECSFAFARNHDLKRHVKIHGGDKSFICNGCGKSFSRLDALRRHRTNSKNRPGCEMTPSESSEPKTS
ncbi:hypothetical protein BX616_000788 [Lobosporangium transversale]|nr:hypothetical protein BX616_000788 [Lobosporangium transversale]